MSEEEAIIGSQHTSYPHFHQTDDNVVQLHNNTTEINDMNYRREAIIGTSIGGLALAVTGVLADTFDNTNFTEVSFSIVGTSVFLGVVYATAPYLNNTRLGRRLAARQQSKKAKQNI